MSDYISRDAAIIEFMDNDIDHIQAPNGKEAVQILSDIPVADVVPIIHTRWRHYDGMYVCENCNAQLDDESPFCPICGAKMDGKEEE